MLTAQSTVTLNNICNIYVWPKHILFAVVNIMLPLVNILWYWFAIFVDCSVVKWLCMLMHLLFSNYICCLLCCKVTTKCWSKCIWFQSPNLKSKSREHAAIKFWGSSCICPNADFPRHFLIPRSDMRLLRSLPTKCVGKNASGSSHPTWNQNLRSKSHLPTCRLSKTLSNSKIRHEAVEIANKMCRQKCI